MLLGLAVGVAGGFWWGSYAGACYDDSSCTVRWDAVSAVGTWVGGLGTIAAVLVAARTFQGEEKARRRAARRAALTAAERQNEDQKNAALIRVGTSVGSYTRSHITELRFAVHNDSTENPVFKVRLQNKEWGIDAQVCHRLDAGHGNTYQVKFGFNSGRESPSVPEDDRQAWLDQILEATIMSFEMNDRVWTRRGQSPPIASS
ncbi:MULTISPECIES: hypothetical protein [unclassified Knoellia]|uniref:hypothetical protein n=1 Tax=Knoellia altitudinis TaxID=3404795 RepID=UPI003615CA0B